MNEVLFVLSMILVAPLSGGSVWFYERLEQIKSNHHLVLEAFPIHH